MLDRQSWEFFKYFFGAYPLRSSVMVGLLVVAGFAEGFGVITLVPVLELAESANREPSKLTQVVTDVLASVGMTPTLGTLLALIVVAITIKAALLWTAMKQVGYTVARVTRDLRMELVRALLRARWAHFVAQPIGRFANAITSEAIRGASAYREACQVLAAIFQILAYLVLSALISIEVTVVAIVAGALIARFLRRFVKHSRAAGLDQTALTKSLAQRLIDVLQGIKPIKAMARENLVLPLLEKETEGLNRAHRRQVLASESLKYLQEPILTALLAIGLFLLLGVEGRPFAEVLILAFIFYRLMQHINTLQIRYQVMVVGESAFWSLRGSIDEASHQAEALPSGAVPTLRRGILFEGVHFAHGEEPVLRGIDLEIPAGEFVALQGESGAGKTTLVDLLTGLYLPDSGRILIDGVPLDEIDQAAWRRSIGYVPQEMLLFNDTIFRNVTLGDPERTREDAERALRMAGVWDFVSALPERMDEMVGERGGRLSGGQRQRIAIARALVTRPSLLILDEITTALDPTTEQAICESLRKLSGQVTIVSISHQSAMQDAADMTYQMRDGTLAPLRQTPLPTA